MSRIFLRVYFTPTDWLGPGKIQLLEAVRDVGSISAAARTMGMSYRRAWLLVEALNGMFSAPVVHTTLGGRGGGAASITPFGEDVIARYRAMEAATRAAIAADRAALERRLSKPKPARRSRRTLTRR